MKRLISTLLFLLWQGQAFAWTVDGMEYTTRIKLTIDQTKIDADLVDLPLLVKLTDARFDWTHSNTDGFDIRFTSSDGSTLLKYERERHDGANYAEYWVKVPVVSGTVDTGFYMYYRTTDTADGADPTNVWDANYKMVQHMTDLTPSSINDSTVNNYDGTKTYGDNKPPEYDAKIYKGQDFVGNWDHIISYGVDVALEGLSQVTMSVWFNPDVLKTSYLFDSVGDTDTKLGMSLSGTSGQINFRVNNGDWSYGLTAIDTYAAGTWYHVVLRFDGTQTGNANRLKGYVNGEQLTLTFGGTVPAATSATIPVIYHGSDSYDGKIDESYASDTARSAAWIKADYNSGNDSLLTYGAEETPPVSEGQVIIITGDD